MLKLFIVLSLFGVVYGNARDRLYYEQKFKSWLKEHAVKADSEEHYLKMFENFSNNDDLIENHNSQNKSYELGHNKFSHMSAEEWTTFVKSSGLNRSSALKSTKKLKSAASPVNVSTLPVSVDWVGKGAVTPVKNQGQCGSCWSFSTTGALEGAYYVKFGKLFSYSEQNLVDCDNTRSGGQDQGCNGGLMDNAFEWIQKNGGLCYEEDYPYTSGTSQKEGTCSQRKCSKDMKIVPKNIVDIQENSDTALMTALAQQPVSVAIEASQSAFQLYKSGVLTADCGSELDHGVLAVGYGEENGVKYYKIKNSWGPEWGEKGYIRIAREVAKQEGQCGILSLPPSYPVL